MKKILPYICYIILLFAFILFLNSAFDFNRKECNAFNKEYGTNYSKVEWSSYSYDIKDVEAFNRINSTDYSLDEWIVYSSDIKRKYEFE